MFLPRMKHLIGIIGTRRDRFYNSSIVRNMITKVETLPCTCSDHDFVMLNLKNQGNFYGVSYGKSYWKLNDDLLNDENFVRLLNLSGKLS